MTSFAISSNYFLNAEKTVLVFAFVEKFERKKSRNSTLKFAEMQTTKLIVATLLGSSIHGTSDEKDYVEGVGVVGGGGMITLDMYYDGLMRRTAHRCHSDPQPYRPSLGSQSVVHTVEGQPWWYSFTYYSSCWFTYCISLAEGG